MFTAPHNPSSRHRFVPIVDAGILTFLVLLDGEVVKGKHHIEHSIVKNDESVLECGRTVTDTIPATYE